MDSANAISLLWRDHRQTAATLAVSANNGDVVFANVNAGYETITIEVVETTPTAFEGLYTVAVEDLSDGVELLAAPVLDGTGEVSQTLSGSAALWVYYPDAYAAAGRDFAPTRQWHRDGQPMPDQTSFTVVADTPGAYTLVESVEAPDGTLVTAVSAAIVVSGGIALTSELMDNRWINLSGIVPDSRKILVVAVLDDAQTTGTDQIVLANAPTKGSWPTDFDASLYIASDTSRGRFSPSDSSVVISNATTSDTINATPRTVALMLAGDLDGRFGTSNTPVIVAGISDLAKVSIGVIDNTYSANSVSLFGDLRFAYGRGANFETAAYKFATGTKLKFLWIATDYAPNTDGATAMNTAFFDAFFSGAPGSWAIKALPPDGVMNINGSPVTPVLFLAGENFGQYDDGGTKRLLNRGTGPDPVLIGDWFA